MKRWIKALWISMILALSACAPTPKADDTAKRTIRIGTEQFTASLDSALEWNGWFTVRYGIGETLFQVEDNMEITPWLISNAENIDTQTWKLTLRENIKFSDGTTMDAKSVVDNLHHIAQENARAAFLKDAEYEIDGNTITIKTVKPRATLLSDLSDPMFAILNLNSKEDRAMMPIGTGPYKVKTFIADQEIVLEPNTNYWNGTPKLDEITVTKMLEKETAILALKNHELDAYTEMNSEGVKQLKDSDEFDIHMIPSSRVYSLYMNTETLSDVSLRKAIAKAIDKESIAKYLLDGTMTATDGPFTSDSEYVLSSSDETSYNQAEAKQILESLGYIDTDGDGYVEKDGQNLSLTIAYYKRLSQEAIATELQSALKKIGIHSELQLHEGTKYLENKEYDLGFYSMVTMPTGDPAYYLNALLSEGGSVNYSGYDNHAMQVLLKQLNDSYDTKERIKLVKQIEGILLSSYSVTYIGFNNLIFATRKGLKNFTPHVTDYYQITVDLELQS